MAESKTGNVAAAFAGAISSMHANMHTWRRDSLLTEEDVRDIDSAQVYLEAAHWKLQTVLDRLAETEKDPEGRHG